MPASLLGSLVGEMSLAQIKFPFDPAPRFVVQLAAAKQLIDVLSTTRRAACPPGWIHYIG
jgi:hypothetical protein